MGVALSTSFWNRGGETRFPELRRTSKTETTFENDVVAICGVAVPFDVRRNLVSEGFWEALVNWLGDAEWETGMLCCACVLKFREIWCHGGKSGWWEVRLVGSQIGGK